MDPRIKSQRKGPIVFLIFFALVIGTVSGVLIASELNWLPITLAEDARPDRIEPSTFLMDSQENFRDLVELVRPAVVSVRASGIDLEEHFQTYGMPYDMEGPYEEFFDQFGNPYERRGPGGGRDRGPGYPNFIPPISEGSGFIVDPEGYILTNNHVVESAESVRVIMDDGKHYRAAVVGTDPETDVAVLKIVSDETFPYIDMGDSDALEVGDWVMAIGNPFGTLAGTVTVGIVSALNREDLPLPGNTYYKNFIQTDAAINLGNSGGPLVDLYGRVVGINTAISAQGSGIGFAIPIDLVRFSYESIVDHGRVVRGWVGLTIQDVDYDIAQHFGPGIIQGALVVDVAEGDPADEAGLQPEDVILEIEGQTVWSKSAATRLIAALPVGEESEMVIHRDGEEMTIVVVPARRGEGPERADADEEVEDIVEIEIPTWEGKGLGINVAEITRTLTRRYDIPADIEGVFITEVDPVSPAFEKGLMTEQVISEVNGEPVETEDDYYDIVDEALEDWDETGLSVLLKIYTEDFYGTWRPIYVAVPFE